MDSPTDLYTSNCTDNLPALHFGMRWGFLAKDFFTVPPSISATEHSVMTAYGNEHTIFEKLLQLYETQP